MSDIHTDYPCSELTTVDVQNVVNLDDYRVDTLNLIFTQLSIIDNRLSVIEGIANNIGEAFTGMKENKLMAKMFGLG